MAGFLWPHEIRERWWLRFPVAIAAAMVLLLAGFVVGSLWAVFGSWPTHHILAPLVSGLYHIPYLGILIIGTLICMMVGTRFSPFILVTFLVMLFFRDVKLSAYLWAFIPFMFYGWFFATMYIVYA